MTNIEKASEIAECCYRDYVDEGNMIGSSEECYESALQAMQWKDEKIKKILITIYSFRDIKNIKGYINEIYKSIAGKYIKLPKCMEEEECYESDNRITLKNKKNDNDKNTNGLVV